MKADLAPSTVETYVHDGKNPRAPLRVWDQSRHSPTGFVLVVSFRGKRRFVLMRDGRVLREWRYPDFDLGQARAEAHLASIAYGRGEAFQAGQATPETLGDLGQAWTDTRVVAPSTESYYRTCWRTVFTGLGAKTRLAALRTDHIQRWVNKTSPAKAEAGLRVLRSAMKLAQARGWIRENPAVLARSPPLMRARDYLSLEDLPRVLSTIPPGPEGRAVIFMLAMGLRPSETINMLAEDIDLGAGVVSWSEHKTSRKTGRKTLYLTELAKEVLKECPDTKRPLSVKGGYAHLRVWWKRHCIEHKLTCVGGSHPKFQHLRRSFATWLADSGASIRDISLALAHTNTRTTETSYIVPTAGARKGVAAQASAILSGVSKVC